ncbi:MAG: dGTP triphosphohydrolase, partial [Reyranella sp.]
MSPGREPPKSGSDDDRTGHRSEFERDFDRILFSTPVRRLSDKTQVFPLDRNDGVRTRLTHSHEVSNLARSIGSRIARERPDAFEGQDLDRTVLPLLGAIGLAHDLGNPPFGHQGEAAISQWFKDRYSWIFDRKADAEDAEKIQPIPHSHLPEFLAFDGNPQTFRLLTRLQTSIGKAGLDLTAATLVADPRQRIGAFEMRDEPRLGGAYLGHGGLAAAAAVPRRRAPGERRQ